MQQEEYPVGTMVITVYGKRRGDNIKSSINLNELTNGIRYFYNVPIERFPKGVTFENLNSGQYMFSYSKLKEVPEGATFNKVTDANRIFE